MTTETAPAELQAATGATNSSPTSWDTDGFSSPYSGPSASWIRTHR